MSTTFDKYFFAHYKPFTFEEKTSIRSTSIKYKREEFQWELKQHTLRARREGNIGRKLTP